MDSNPCGHSHSYPDSRWYLQSFPRRLGHSSVLVFEKDGQTIAQDSQGSDFGGFDWRLAEAERDASTLSSTKKLTRRLPPLDKIGVYIVLNEFFHIFNLRELGLITDDEWDGWIRLMKRTLQSEVIRRHWTDASVSAEYSLSFQRFVNEKLLMTPTEAGSRETSAAQLTPQLGRCDDSPTRACQRLTSKEHGPTLNRETISRRGPST